MYVCVRLYWYAFLYVFLYVHILIIHAIQHTISLSIQYQTLQKSFQLDYINKKVVQTRDKHIAII